MKKIIIITLVIMSCLQAGAQNSVMLKLNPEKNKVYRLKSATAQTIVQTVNGNQQTVESKVNYVFSIKMVDATPGFMVAEVHFDTLATKTNTMGKTSDISSFREGNIKSSDAADIMTAIMNRLSKNSVFAKIDYSGKVLEIINLKMVSDQIVRDTSAITLTGPMAEGVKNQIVNLVSDNSIKTMIEVFTRYLPGKEVSSGAGWSSSQKTNSGGMALDIATTFHLDALNNYKASITAESEIKPAGNADPIKQGGATITYDDLKGVSKSSIVLDVRTGLIIEDKAKTHIAGNLGVSGPGFSMQMPMDINGESSIIALQ